MSLVHVNKRCVLTIVIGITVAIVVVGTVVLVVLCFHFTTKNESSVVVYRWGKKKNQHVSGRNPVNGTVFLPLKYSVADDTFPPEDSPLMISFLYNIQFYDKDGKTNEEDTTLMLIVTHVYFDYDQIVPFYENFGNFSQNTRESFLKNVFKNITDLQFFEDDLNYDAHHRTSTAVLDRVNQLFHEYVADNGFPFHLKDDVVTYVRPFKTD